MNSLKYKKSMFRDVPDGWKDTGKVSVVMHKDIEHELKFHNLCNTGTRRGMTEDQIFIYCPKCKVKIDIYDTTRSIEENMYNGRV